MKFKLSYVNSLESKAPSQLWKPPKSDPVSYIQYANVKHQLIEEFQTQTRPVKSRLGPKMTSPEKLDEDKYEIKREKVSGNFSRMTSLVGRHSELLK